MLALSTVFAAPSDSTFTKNFFIYGTIARAGTTTEDTFYFNSAYVDNFDTTSTVTNIFYQSCGDYPLGSTRKTNIAVKRAGTSWFLKSNQEFVTLSIKSYNAYVYTTPVTMNILSEKIHSVFKPKSSTVTTLFLESAVNGRADQYTTISNIGNIFVPTSTLLGRISSSPKVLNTVTSAHKDTLVLNYYNILDSANATIKFDTILFPSSPSDNDFVEVKTTKAITTVVYSGNGATVRSQASLGVGTYVKWIYDSLTSTWY